MKIVLAGSPSISVPTFEKIINNFDVLAIVTQPDKPQGRGMKIKETPVATLARKYNIKTFKPTKISTIEDELKSLNFDLFLTFAFGQYIPEKILQLGTFKSVNIHGSLLPKYRGAAPIHAAILNGDQEIGITLIEMIKKMDAGDMYFKASQKINNETTTGEGFEIVSQLAEKNIVDWLNQIESKNVKPVPQPTKYSEQGKISKAFARVTTDMDLETIERKIRGLNPFPGAYTFIDNKRIKLYRSSRSNIKGSIPLKTNNGTLYIVEYQQEGKKRTIVI